MDDVSMRLSFEGGDAGGVSGPRTGTGPGEHTGMCLLGIAAGVPREDVFNVKCGGGVEDRPGMGGALATIVAMLTRISCSGRHATYSKWYASPRTQTGNWTESVLADSNMSNADGLSRSKQV